MKWTYVMIVILLVLPVVPQSSGAQVISPNSLEVTGSIADNYLDMQYGFEFTGSDRSDAEIELEFIIPDGIYLSNLSVVSDEVTYYSQVLEIDEAQQTYDSAVESNKSAVLIEVLGYNPATYLLKANIKQGKTIQVNIMVEGYILRHRGEYDIQFLEFPNLLDLDVNVDIDLLSTYTEYNSPRLVGLVPASISSVDQGYHISYSHEDDTYEDTYAITYSMISDKSDKIIGYSNGVDNYFVYQLAPEIYTVDDQMPRRYIFTIDTSGSMGEIISGSGESATTRMDAAKMAFSTIMGTLNPGDEFNVLSFDSTIKRLWSSPRNATVDNINNATSWVNELNHGGSTNINDALLTSLQQVSSETDHVKAITFLSDGEPTSGTVDPDQIALNVENANTYGTQIFTIAFGSGSDEHLMTTIAYDSSGKYSKVRDSSDADQSLIEFYGEFASPVSLGLDIDLDTAYDVAPDLSRVEKPIFNGSEVLITGKFDNSLTARTVIPYLGTNDTYTTTLDNVGSQNSHVERIWAINMLDRLLESYVVNMDADTETRILDLALQYDLVVKDFTAIVLVVDPTAPQPNDITAEGEGGAVVGVANYPMTLVLLVTIVIWTAVVRRKRE